MWNVKSSIVDDEFKRTVIGWYRDRNEPCMESFLSDLGAMAYYQGEPVAAAFLYTTNSSWAMLESYIADPYSDKLVRREAVRRLTERLLNEAKNLGFKIVTSTVSQASMATSLLEAGMFTDSKPYQVIAALLED